MSQKTDKLLERYDSYIITNQQTNGQVYIIIELISNKWYRFNKKITYRAEQNADSWWADTSTRAMIQRCENHFGY